MWAGESIFVLFHFEYEGVYVFLLEYAPFSEFVLSSRVPWPPAWAYLSPAVTWARPFFYHTCGPECRLRFRGAFMCRGQGPRA